MGKGFFPTLPGVFPYSYQAVTTAQVEKDGPENQDSQEKKKTGGREMPAVQKTRGERAGNRQGAAGGCFQETVQEKSIQAGQEGMTHPGGQIGEDPDIGAVDHTHNLAVYGETTPGDDDAGTSRRSGAVRAPITPGRFQKPLSSAGVTRIRPRSSDSAGKRRSS